MKLNKFEQLQAWREAHALALMIYKETNKFPNDEKFRLVNQLCRSASSVPANLVEGNARGHRKEFIQFAYQARGSLEETKYHLLLARDLDYLNSKEYEGLVAQAERTGKLINGLIRYLRSTNQDRVTNK
ncbi:MAG TPA: four helix bundle protein [Patescibacteria group bacterium]|nr:four helix bundle protein [Patescibacteria group bacterium]